MSTQDTSHNATNPDPTPRTAATARERDIYETVREVIRDYTCLPFGLGEAKEMCSRITSALATAEAPGRVTALEADIADIYYRLESALGHLDGAPEAVVQDVYFTFARAERAAERAGIIGPDLVASVLDVGAPAPTPSEPVGRVPEELRKWLLAVDKVHTGTVPGGLRLRHGRCTTCGMLKVGLDAHPTPATRDE